MLIREEFDLLIRILKAAFILSKNLKIFQLIIDELKAEKLGTLI